MWPILKSFPILGIVLALMCLTSCTDNQLARSQTAVETAEVWHARAIAAEAFARSALEQVQALTATVESDRADKLLADAESALGLAHTAVQQSGAAVVVAKAAQASAQAAHDAGGGTGAVILAGVGSFILGLGMIFPKFRVVSLALSQVVRGVGALRNRMGEDEWKDIAAPAMDAAQDDKTKRVVAQVQAKAA